MKLLQGYQYYPIKEKDSKYYIETEYGKFEISKYEIHCHECNSILAYMIEPEEVPRMTSVFHNRNFYIPYFYRISGECFKGVHGGFSRPVWEIGKKTRQCRLEEWA